ncbi:hypothetical protein C8R46DRAFT_1136305 [Mycena filopes]|nr:hypothetical protein C8R46DRAFT_1136305 [Mycena filopes]
MPCEYATILPPELWFSVFASLLLPDLVNISAACSAFQSLALPSLETHKALRARYRSLGHDADVYYTCYWYRLLLDVLREPAAAYYVEDLEVEHTDRDLARNVNPDTPWTVAPADAALVRRAVETEVWIPEAEKEDLVERILEDGDEDAVVTLLVLRAPNLRRLSLPTYCWGGLDFEYLMPIVARIALAAADDANGVAKATTSEFTEDGVIAPLPLSKLEHYEGQVFNGLYGVDFESITPLMVLPSLRSLSTGWNHEEGFEWPAALPKSNVREIRIENGTVVLEAILRLARGIRGPCIIEQEWGYRRHSDTPEEDWRTLEIPFEGAGEELWVITGRREG